MHNPLFIIHSGFDLNLVVKSAKHCDFMVLLDSYLMSYSDNSIDQLIIHSVNRVWKRIWMIG